MKISHLIQIPLSHRWRKVRSSEDDEEQQSTRSLWSPGIAALKKIREWSEDVV
ncbi:hypothetical protein Hanom_Chr08g00735641 [Helianthus anomalus]